MSIATLHRSGKKTDPIIKVSDIYTGYSCLLGQFGFFPKDMYSWGMQTSGREHTSRCLHRSRQSSPSPLITEQVPQSICARLRVEILQILPKSVRYYQVFRNRYRRRRIISLVIKRPSTMGLEVGDSYIYNIYIRKAGYIFASN